jgi:hypothetical protein
MSMTSLDAIKSALTGMLQGIERYNPDNIATLERYVFWTFRQAPGQLKIRNPAQKFYLNFHDDKVLPSLRTYLVCMTCQKEWSELLV